MSGTIVDYSKSSDSIHYIKILSGEKLFTFYLDKHPGNAKMGSQVVFNPVTRKWRSIK